MLPWNDTSAVTKGDGGSEPFGKPDLQIHIPLKLKRMQSGASNCRSKRRNGRKRQRGLVLNTVSDGQLRRLIAAATGSDSSHLIDAVDADQNVSMKV